jgi:hypothetical protein
MKIPNLWDRTSIQVSAFCISKFNAKDRTIGAEATVRYITRAWHSKVRNDSASSTYGFKGPLENGYSVRSCSNLDVCDITSFT